MQELRNLTQYQEVETESEFEFTMTFDDDVNQDDTVFISSATKSFHLSSSQSTNFSMSSSSSRSFKFDQKNISEFVSHKRATNSQFRFSFLLTLDM